MGSVDKKRLEFLICFFMLFRYVHKYAILSFVYANMSRLKWLLMLDIYVCMYKYVSSYMALKNSQYVYTNTKGNSITRKILFST